MSENTQKLSAAEVAAILKENPSVILETLVKKSGLPLAKIIELLPDGMWAKRDGSAFVAIMQALSKLGEMTLVMNTPDAIIEFSGAIPEGKVGFGYYNLLGSDSPLHGHIHENACQAIYLVKRDFMKKPTISLQFMNAGGQAIFKIFASRDKATGEIHAAQAAAMSDWFDGPQAGEA